MRVPTSHEFTAKKACGAGSITKDKGGSPKFSLSDQVWSDPILALLRKSGAHGNCEDGYRFEAKARR